MSLKFCFDVSHMYYNGVRRNYEAMEWDKPTKDLFNYKSFESLFTLLLFQRIYKKKKVGS